MESLICIVTTRPDLQENRQEVTSKDAHKYIKTYTGCRGTS